MNFLLDAHLPPGLCALLQAAGHDVVHNSLVEMDRIAVQVVI